MNITDLLRDEIKNLVPYHANQIDCKIKMDANESPYSMPKEIKAEVAKLFSDEFGINLYPDTDSNKLREALANKWGLPKDMFMVGNGSDQVIQILISTFAGKGDTVLCPTPSFSMYGQSAQINGATIVEYKLKEETGYDLDIDELISLARELKPKIIFICNPNNPTGGFTSTEAVKSVLEECQNSIIAVDEAYNEFVNDSCVDFLSTYKNLVILRTFSKAFGLAGVRCGYSIAPKDFTECMNRVRPPYNLNSLTQQVCTITLKYQTLIDQYISKIIEERKWLGKELKKISGIKVYDSCTNFYLVRVENAMKVTGSLLKDGILVRAFGPASELGECFRVTVGTREQNEAFIEALKKALNL
jgi:histidinol-phosphate aminotransferase